MSIKDPKGYVKGPMGYYLDIRKGMEQISRITLEWCKAFDAGDTEAMDLISVEIGDIQKGFEVAMAGVEGSIDGA